MGQDHSVAGENGLDTGLEGHFQLKGIEENRIKRKEPTVIVHNGEGKRSVQDDEDRNNNNNVWGEDSCCMWGQSTIWPDRGLCSAFTMQYLCNNLCSRY